MNRSAILALAGVASLAALSVVVTRPGETKTRAAQWVMPDCADDKTEVDCRFGGPYSPDGGPIWRGCNVGLAEHAVGSACIAASPRIAAGNRLEKRNGQAVEIDRKGRELRERVFEVFDGGSLEADDKLVDLAEEVSGER